MEREDMEWWTMQISQVEKTLQTDSGKGLQEGEASRRLTLDGKNRLEQGNEKKGFLQRFFYQFNDFMILLLIGAAAVMILLIRVFTQYRLIFNFIIFCYRTTTKQ